MQIEQGNKIMVVLMLILVLIAICYRQVTGKQNDPRVLRGLDCSGQEIEVVKHEK